MSEVDPPRLREGKGELASLLREAHDDLPDDREMSQIAAHLSPPTPWPWGLSPKLLGGLGVATLFAGLAGLAGPPLLARFSPEPASLPAARSPQPATSESAASLPTSGEPAGLPAAAREPATGLPAAARDPATGEPGLPTSPGPGGEPARGGPAASLAEAATGLPEGQNPARRPGAARALPAATATTPAPVASATATASAAPPAIDPMLEISLLDQARRKSASAPAEALALATEHARLFPRSSFGTEREVIVIEALQRSGRADEAQSRARRFLEAYPRTAYRERLERLLR